MRELTQHGYRPKPEDRQLKIVGLDQIDEKLVNEAREWIDDNPDEWAYMVENAYRLAESTGYVSVNYLVNMVRNEHVRKVKNGYAPVFARVMRASFPSLKDAIKVNSSKADGFV